MMCKKQGGGNRFIIKGGGRVPRKKLNYIIASTRQGYRMVLSAGSGKEKSYFYACGLGPKESCADGYPVRTYETGLFLHSVTRQKNSRERSNP